MIIIKEHLLKSLVKFIFDFIQYSHSKNKSFINLNSLNMDIQKILKYHRFEINMILYTYIYLLEF